MRYFAGLLTTLVSAWIFAGGANAQRADLGAKCLATSAGRVTCNIWISDPGNIQQVTVRQAAGGEEQEVTFSPYDDAGSRTYAYLILVDKSDPRRQDTITKVRDAINGIIDKAPQNHRIGLANFADKLEILAPIGSSSAKLKIATDRLRAEGSATELFRAAEEGIEALVNYRADSKALVIFSDGKAEDTNAFPIERVLRRARQESIVIYGVGYPERAADAPSLQSLRRLASDTGGPFVSAILPDKTLPEDFTNNFYRYLQTGGTISFDAARSGRPGETIEYTITARTNDDKTITGNADVAFVAGPMQDPIGWIQRQYEENQIAVIASGGGAVLVLAGLVFLIARQARRRRAAAGDEAALGGGQEAAKKRLVLAWLEVVEDGGRRIPIDETSVRIGRHSDNDIRIEEDSDQSTVHRRHATIHVTPERDFIITDLSGKNGNGVFVNSERIERKELSDGDVIELGLVKLRFQIADI